MVMSEKLLDALSTGAGTRAGGFVRGHGNEQARALGTVADAAHVSPGERSQQGVGEQLGAGVYGEVRRNVEKTRLRPHYQGLCVHRPFARRTRWFLHHESSNAATNILYGLSVGVEENSRYPIRGKWRRTPNKHAAGHNTVRVERNTFNAQTLRSADERLSVGQRSR